MAYNGFTLCSRKCEDLACCLQAEYQLQTAEAQFVGRTLESDLCIKCVSCSYVLSKNYLNQSGNILLMHHELCDFISDIKSN